MPYRLLFDSESNGLVDNATKIHCVTAMDVDTEERLDYRPGDKRYLDALDKADTVIGHNIQRHDIPLIGKIDNWKPRPTVLIRDTMICARVIYPNVRDTDKALVLSGKMPPGKDYQGKHTLGAWGYRLGKHKGDYAKVKEAEALAKGITDPDAILRYVWGEWNEEMHTYALGDRETNYDLWKHLRVDKYSPEAIELEHRIQFVCDQMERAGVPFDIDAAHKLHVELIAKRDEVEKKLVETFGSWLQPVSPDYNKATAYPKQKPNKNQDYFWWEPDRYEDTGTFTKTGRMIKRPVWTDHVNGKALCPSYTKLKLVQFNPGSRDHVARLLEKRGWKPEKLTEGGKPQINEEVVADASQRYPEFAGLADYLMIEKRLSQLADGDGSWLNYVKDDGRIHGVINPMGTTTSRGAHMFPNLGQVPNLASPYGKECRSLFYAPKGWTIVGADQQGLELRGLAHYLFPLDGGKYASVVLDGDPHWMHACAMGLAEGERDKHNKLHIIIREDGSKRFIYAYIYGCGDGKAGEIIYTCIDKAQRECGLDGKTLFVKFFPNGHSESAVKRVGKTIRNSFATRITGFAKLKENLAAQVEKFGWVPGLDKRRIPVRSEHSALNFLIQSAGAIVCKRWVVDAFDAMCARFKYDFVNPWNGEFVFGLWVHDEIQVWVREGLEEETKRILVDCASKAGVPYGFRLRLDGEAKAGRTWADTH